MPKDENRRGLGECADELEALDKALAIFDDADGCQHCCLHVVDEQVLPHEADLPQGPHPNQAAQDEEKIGRAHV